MTPTITHFFAWVLAWGFSGMELAVMLVLGLLIFGRRLPELGRSVGKTIVEFKKGLAGIESDVNNSANNNAAGNQSNQNQNQNQNQTGALPSSSQQNSSVPQSSDATNPYSQGQYRPPQG